MIFNGFLPLFLAQMFGFRGNVYLGILDFYEKIIKTKVVELDEPVNSKLVAPSDLFSNGGSWPKYLFLWKIVKTQVVEPDEPVNSKPVAPSDIFSNGGAWSKYFCLRKNS